MRFFNVFNIKFHMTPFNLRENFVVKPFKIIFVPVHTLMKQAKSFIKFDPTRERKYCSPKQTIQKN